MNRGVQKEYEDLLLCGLASHRLDRQAWLLLFSWKGGAITLRSPLNSYAKGNSNGSLQGGANPSLICVPLATLILSSYAYPTVLIDQKESNVTRRGLSSPPT